jgi:signal transduction histidine kinase
MPRRGEPGSTDFGDARSARLLAHELNNIALPLRGFVELAEDAPGDAQALRECFQEIRAGSRRLAELARDLAALAEDQPRRRLTTLGACLPAPAERFLLPADPAIRLRADPDLLRSSIALLVKALGSDVLFTALHARSRHVGKCDDCGVRMARTHHLLLHVQAPRTSLLRALRDPLDSSLRLSPTQRVRIAASARQLHLAGAHFSTGAPDAIIALPLAAHRKT